ncbi:penicillin binding protein PBP4B [Bacillus halotolerans]|uniref:penicillin binding protein PBP4B n=2 Tax=Bacillus halotolerans TaxID=260554 RepID=UPI000FD82F64|nr:penicillin binding protein PBP4B [Bacillus halotolerans]AZV49181.1 penicillin binding protein PBP4B [Bacillus halotolerans]MBV7319974.1 penicillin binding protein PBP4B [Halalkalibacterium halodurans]QNS20551.1 penicillin binding protein PBP4B [Bacillus halotolerans]
MRTKTLALLSAILTVSILTPNEAFAQTALHQADNQVEPKTINPETAQFSSKKLRKVDQMIERDIAAGFPGAVLVVVKDGRMIKKEAYGYSKKYDGAELLRRPAKMKTRTMFDLASNTKMYAANFALQRLVSQGKLDVYEKVSAYLPDFKDQPTDRIKGKDNIRVIDVLQHQSGLPSSFYFYSPEKAGMYYSQEREKTIEYLMKIPLDYETGTKHVYSDIGYMLLGCIVEKLTGKPLDVYTEQELYKPLKLKHTLYNPLQKGFKAKQFAATERMGNTRDGVIHFPHIRIDTLQGEVHDEKAFYSMEGVSGHAGLFSNADDMAILLQVMLNKGTYRNVSLFDQKTADLFTAPSATDPTFGLGWRRNGSKSMEWMFGPYASENAYGHTGWTGTVTIIDPAYNLGIALLTNKKHSPVADPAENPNVFEGDQFSTGSYGSVITAIYEAMK